MRPVILDFDGSVGEWPGATRFVYRQWHDSLRFACSRRRLAALGRRLPRVSGTVFLGSGDFHHLTLPLVGRLAARGVHVLVFDNHPDNMRFPFGVHCGSWVARLAAMPQVARVDVVGISSADIGWRHAWENHLWPLYRGRVRYWSTGVDVGWARRVGLGHAVLGFADVATLMTAVSDMLAKERAPVYLSIDKDVLSPDEASTNWDQGRLRVADLLHAIDLVRPRLVGSDVTGEISIADYPQRWKRWLSALDRQPTIDRAALPDLQARQLAVNQVLWRALSS